MYNSNDISLLEAVQPFSYEVYLSLHEEVGDAVNYVHLSVVNGYCVHVHGQEKRLSGELDE